MDDLVSPKGEAFAAYIDGKDLSDNPYHRNTNEWEEWMLEMSTCQQKELNLLREEIRQLEVRIGGIRRIRG